MNGTVCTAEFAELMDHIWQTIMHARQMAQEAVELKHDCPDLAAAYYRCAGNRCTDADMLIKQAESCVDKAQTEQPDSFDDMDVILAADKSRMMRELINVKICMDMYR